MIIVTHAAAAVLGAALAVAGTAAFLNARHDAELAEQGAYSARLSADYSNQIAMLATAGREAEAAARAEEQRRTLAHQGELDASNHRTAAARADARSAAAAADRLRARVDQLVAAAARRGDGAADPATSGRSQDQPGTGALDLLADVLSRADAAAGQLAAYADGARIAGLTCERMYDALSEVPR